MVTYLIGTDGEGASQTLRRFMTMQVGPGDVLEVVNVLTNSDLETAREGEAALAPFEDAFDEAVTVRTRQLNRGNPPAEELLSVAEEVEADQIVMGLRQHSRTERIIFGSVSQSLLQQTDRPVTLVPLPEYTLAEAPGQAD